ncbi:MAG: preprotein translocase subunit SecG [Gammaproteobacteria bacterium]
MIQLLLILHVLISVLLIVLVLVQQGKGATVGAAFGTGASSTVFGSRGSGGFLMRLTGGLAIAFFVTSLALTYIATHASKPDDQVLLKAPTTVVKQNKESKV